MLIPQVIVYYIYSKGIILALSECDLEAATQRDGNLGSKHRKYGMVHLLHWQRYKMKVHEIIFRFFLYVPKHSGIRKYSPSHIAL